MGAHRRGNGYFGKTGTVSRELRPRRRITRRQFLAGTTLTGVALTLPPWLVGCGDDDDHGRANTPTPTATPSPTPGARPRERRTLDFDFSLAPLSELRLQAFNSQSHRAPIREHTAESRAKHRGLNPALNDVPDERLTHYIEDVDLPSDALQHLWVTGSDASGGAAVAALHIHVPAAARQAATQGVLNGGSDYLTPVSTAVSLVFHSPEIMNLNVDQGSTILNLIQTLPCTDDPTCTPYLGTLTAQIAEKWPASTSGGWATLVELTDSDNQPVFDKEGKPLYRYDLDPDIVQAVAAVGGQIKKAIFDDPQFRGTNWHPTQGITVSQSSATSGLTARPAGAAQFALTAAYPAGATAHGVAFESISVTDQASRTVQLQFRNQFVRYLSTFVQFANEQADLPVANPTSKDTSRAKFLSWINCNYTILGIPLMGDDVPLSSVQFDVPTDASIAKVFFGSLGLGGQAFSPEALDGSILTLLLDIAIPTMLMAAGVAVSAATLNSLLEVISNPTVIQVLNTTFASIIASAGGDIANGAFGSHNSNSMVDVLIEFGNAIVTAIFANAGGLVAAKIAEVIADAVLEDVYLFAPLVGVAVRIAAAIADLAAIVVSIAEVLSCPALFINQLTLTQTTTVTISHDPNDFQFPATSRNYEVRLVYDSSSTVSHVQGGPIEPGRVDPIVAVFDDVPSGGNVTVDVYLTTESGCIVGRSTGTDGTTGPYGPVPGTQASIAIMIKELLIPLTQTTQYLHDLKLEYQGGQHVWVETDAPTATIADLGSGQENALYDLNGITISQRTGMAGYAYRAGGQGVPFCGSNPPVSGIAYMLQNVFLGENPDRALKQLPCGFQEVAGIVYDRLGPASGMGRNFFLQPSAGGFLVQSITLDDSTPIDITNPLSWGMFSEALDSLAVVPTGYVVGVNRQNHHMQILELPPAALEASQLPPFAVAKMGFGTRPGLLNAPVAVTVIDATILILEDGNQRIQAVDVSGNPVLRFNNGTSSIVTLQPESDVTYLDLGVEGLGYLYVLSFINDGTAVDDYRLDVYDPQGAFLTRTTGVAAARLAVDTFRNVYTLNYEVVANAPRIEPSLSQWNPSTPEGCPTAPPIPTATATP